MIPLKLDALSQCERSFESKDSDKSFVIRATSQLSGDNKEKTFSYFKENAEAIKNLVKENGIVLFRDFSISSIHDYEKILETLGYDLFKTNKGGASPRANITQKTFVSTEAPSPFIIGFHTEFCYQNKRPEMISFYCVEPSPKYGETPLFDCHKMWRSLSNELRGKLKKKGLLYKRYFHRKKTRLNFKKSWQEAFETQNKKGAEAFLESEGMTYQWDKHGNLATELKIPAIIEDPVNGKTYLGITMFNADSFLYNFKYFESRYNPIFYYFLQWFVKMIYSKEDAFLQVFFGDSTTFSKAESEEIQRAAWDNAIVYHWKPKDLLIIDNIRFGHSRLNVTKPRKIIAAMANKYDIRQYKKESTNYGLEYP